MKDKERKGKLSLVEEEKDVVELYPSSDSVLKNFMGTHPKIMLVLAMDKEGEIHVGTNTSDKGDLLFVLEQFRHCLMSGDFDN
jgi:hypothetical protein